MRIIQKILVDEKTGKKHPVKDLTSDFHTSSGIVKKEYLQSGKTIVTTTKGKTFFLADPMFPDIWEILQRGPQIMIQKDIGLILAKTGVNQNSTIIDAGGGSGALCLSLANICKEITVYEINPEHYDVVAKNIRLVGFSNITLKQDNIYDGISEKGIDIITLDLPEPWKVIDHAEKALIQGGHLVVYLPNLTQVKTFIDVCRNSGIKIIEITELLERKWKIEHQIMRPEFEMLGHTGFLVFCRKF